jgi:hypothetical protein
MPGIIDHEVMQANELPPVWAPVQWEQSEAELSVEIDRNASANLLFNSDAPEAVLRLLLNETDSTVAYDPPHGYKPEEQGEWDPEVMTFAFLRPMKLEHIERGRDVLVLLYDFGSRGHWRLEIGPERVLIERV